MQWFDHLGHPKHAEVVCDIHGVVGQLRSPSGTMYSTHAKLRGKVTIVKPSDKTD